MKPVLLPVVLFFVCACGPVNKAVRPTATEMNKVKRLAVCVPGEGPFTVIDERAKATATPVILFGLVGAMVASAHNQQSDSDKAKTLGANLEGISCRPLFIGALKEALTEYNRYTDADLLDTELKPEGMSKYDAVVTFQINSWGLRLVERSQGELMKPFVEVHARMVIPGGQTLWEEREVFAGSGRNSLSAYQYEKGLLKKDMEEAIKGAGRKMAVALIYQ